MLHGPPCDVSDSDYSIYRKSTGHCIGLISPIVLYSHSKPCRLTKWLVERMANRNVIISAIDIELRGHELKFVIDAQLTISKKEHGGVGFRGSCSLHFVPLLKLFTWWLTTLLKPSIADPSSSAMGAHCFQECQLHTTVRAQWVSVGTVRCVWEWYVTPTCTHLCVPCAIGRSWQSISLQPTLMKTVIKLLTRSGTLVHVSFEHVAIGTVTVWNAAKPTQYLIPLSSLFGQQQNRHVSPYLMNIVSLALSVCQLVLGMISYVIVFTVKCCVELTCGMMNK